MSNEMMKREMQEAVQAGERALQSLYAARDKLGSARNWGISALNIKSRKETEKSIGMNPKYTIKFYCDTTNQDEEKDIKEITLYENGEYATIFITSPGGVKQNYKTSIDISELVI